MTEPDAEAPRAYDDDDVLRYVDPMIGTTGLGNVFPGALVPFGFAAVSPDTIASTTSGYHADHEIVGFSNTHVSGVGGGSLYGNLRITPFVGPARTGDLASGKADETATPGFYAVRLTRDDVGVELAAARRTGIHRYSFPASPAGPSRLLIDATSVIFDPVSGKSSYAWQRPVSSRLTVQGPKRLDGTVTIAGGYSYAPYTLHFCVVLDRPWSAAATFLDDTIGPAPHVGGGERQRAGALLTFDTSRDPNVVVRVGLSFVSVAQAYANLRQELGNRPIEAIADAARQEWRRALGQLAVEGGSVEQRTAYYTALYRSHVMPHDLTGENIWTDAHVHYEDFYTLWDTFRTLYPLLLLIEPERHRDLLRTLIDVYASTGWLPTARTAGQNGLQQVGTHADTVIADAYVKGVRGLDYRTAYAGMRQNATVPPPYPVIEGQPTIALGRPGIAEYARIGFVPLEFHAPARPAGVTGVQASRTVEYAYNDFCVAQVAAGLGYTDDRERFHARSANWANLWDEQSRSIRPRHEDGTFLEPFDPTVRARSNDAFYEGSGYQYSTFVPHDVQGLIDRLGGDEPFVAWLDRFFDNGNGAHFDGFYQQYNEHDLLAAYLYIHAGRPDRTVDRVRALLATQYSTATDGLPGNDDSGAMSSWYVWGALGLYPNAGQAYYYIGSPVFTRSRIRLPARRNLVVEAPGSSDRVRYVRSARLNGRELGRSWLWHAELIEGGLLELDLAAEPSSFGRGHGPSVRPPSVSAGSRSAR